MQEHEYPVAGTTTPAAAGTTPGAASAATGIGAASAATGIGAASATSGIGAAGAVGAAPGSVGPGATRTVGGTLSQWDVYVERLRTQLPAAPEGLLSAYVRWAPWIAIVFGVFGFLGLLALLGLTAVFSPLLLLAGAEGVRAGGDLVVTLLVGLVLAAAEVVGGYQMLHRRETGWWILALGLAVNLLSGLFHGSLFGLLVTLLVAYVHVQVRPRYR